MPKYALGFATLNAEIGRNLTKLSSTSSSKPKASPAAVVPGVAADRLTGIKRVKNAERYN